MRKDSVLFGVAGVFFGLLVGWIVGSQQAAVAPRAPEPAPAQTAASGEKPPPPLDDQRVAGLKASVERNPADAASRVQLANLYFDSERFTDAIRWYEEALKIDPRNPDASTDLGITYYYTNQVDRALAQFGRSLEIDPTHTKTLLNIGFVRAYGKQDLDGAARAWQRVVEIAPASPEGQRAKQALEALRSAHPGDGAAPQPPAGKSPADQDARKPGSPGAR
jgi:cytochrome c-type biogenesis protein CcmH/NrfG